MTHASLQQRIMRYLKSVGAYAENIPGNELMSGVPDIIGCYQGIFLGLEVKMPSDTPSPLQKVKLRDIQKSGGIGEVIYSLDKVRSIIDAIKKGNRWDNTTY